MTSVSETCQPDKNNQSPFMFQNPPHTAAAVANVLLVFCWVLSGMLASLTIIQKVHKSLSLQTKNEHIYDLWHQTLEHTTTWVLLVDWGPTQNHLLLTNMFLESKINCFVSETHEVPVCCHLEKCPLEHLQNQNLLGTKAAPCGQTFCTEHLSFKHTWADTTPRNQFQNTEHACSDSSCWTSR